MTIRAVPLPIKLFAMLFLGNGVVLALHRFLMRYEWEAEGAAIFGDLVVPVTLVPRLALVVLLTWGVCARASRLAKWSAVVLIAGSLARLPQAWEGLAEANLNAQLWTVALVLGVGAVAFLFTRDARYWFATKGRTVAADATAFE